MFLVIALNSTLCCRDIGGSARVIQHARGADGVRILALNHLQAILGPIFPFPHEPHKVRAPVRVRAGDGLAPEQRRLLRLGEHLAPERFVGEKLEAGAGFLLPVGRQRSGPWTMRRGFGVVESQEVERRERLGDTLDRRERVFFLFFSGILFSWDLLIPI